MLTLGELAWWHRHASPASIWFCCPGKPVRYTCACCTDWIWHLLSQHGWIPRPQHSLLRPRLSTSLTQASTPSAQRWSRGKCVCNNSSSLCCSAMSMHLVVHFIKSVCSGIPHNSSSHSYRRTELELQPSGEPQCMYMCNSTSCNHMSSGRCRCIQMLAGLWNAPESGKTEGEQRLGTSTIGSSEACMLGGLALKRRWTVARKKAGKPTDKPNLILGINAQVSQLTAGTKHVLRIVFLCNACSGCLRLEPVEVHVTGLLRAEGQAATLRSIMHSSIHSQRLHDLSSRQSASTQHSA